MADGNSVVRLFPKRADAEEAIGSVKQAGDWLAHITGKAGKHRDRVVTEISDRPATAAVATGAILLAVGILGVVFAKRR